MSPSALRSPNFVPAGGTAQASRARLRNRTLVAHFFFVIIHRNSGKFLQHLSESDAASFAVQNF
jgi:hypothetical protein